MTKWSLRAGIRIALVLAIGASGIDLGYAQSVEGWRAGPSKDATMAVGQRFVCRGPDCTQDLACLYAAAPPRPPASRWLKVEDVTNDKVWPWKEVEYWLAYKLNELYPGLINDPAAPATNWSIPDRPLTFEIDGEDFAERIYSIKTPSGTLTVPLYFWTSAGRLFTMFCSVHDTSIGRSRTPIHRLLSALHPGEPKRDIPKRF